MNKHDYALILKILYQDFAMQLALLDEECTLNGELLRQKLINELSLVIYPGTDRLGTSSIYEYRGDV